MVNPQQPNMFDIGGDLPNNLLVRSLALSDALN